MKSSQTHYPSLFGFLLSAIATLLLLALAFILGMSALFIYLTESSVDAQATTYSVTISFLGILLGIVSVISLLRYMNKPFADVPIKTSFEGWKIAAGVTGAGLALIIGSLVQNISSINWLALPVLTIPAVALPIWTITGLGTRNLALGSRWRTWSIFGISLTVTPFILFILETFILIAIFILVVIYVVANPDVAAEFERLSSQFLYIDIESETGMEQALRLMAPYLIKPGVVIPAMFFLSVLVPLLEELIKPLAVWLLAGRLKSAAQGFSLGALCGAGFALWETFNVSGQTAEWSALLFTRIGTGLLHITTSALMGGAIYMAIREHRYLRLLGTYLLVVFLHGLWNAFAVSTSFTALMAASNQLEQFESYQWVALAGLISLTGVLLAILISSNWKLQKTMPVETTKETPAPQDNTSP